jgi:amino acid transporter
LLIAALVFSYIMHLFIADIAIRGNGRQISTTVSDTLFTGKIKKPLTFVLFLIVGVVLLTSMAAYVKGGGAIISEYLKTPPFIGNLIFYAAAALIVLLGLKSVGRSEGIAVAVILAVIAALSAASLFNLKNPLPTFSESAAFRDIAGYLGMAMFCFTAFFAVPQAVEGLNCDPKKTKRAIKIGFANILVLMAAVILCSLAVSDEVTEIAMLGWAKGIGAWAEAVGAVFILLALATTYWSISLALSNMIKEQFPRLPFILGWLIATLPSLLITLADNAGFTELMEIAAGAAAIVLAFLIVPAAQKAAKESPSLILGKLNVLPVRILIIAVYLFMAFGNLYAV